MQVRESEGNVRKGIYHLIASRHVGAGEHFLPVGVLLLHVLPAALLYAAQAAHISFCWSFFLHIITAITGAVSLLSLSLSSVCTVAVDCCFIQQMRFSGKFDLLAFDICLLET